jgi:Permuted papain-like amidase enzyme, YaeF/YiiX, C92 family
MIEEGQSLLKEGDLIVRLNRDPSSLFVKNFNRHDKRYSHSGIVLFENGYPYVFHMINGQENPDGRLRLDSLKQFCNPVHNKSYGIFRYNMNETELKKIKNIIHKYYAEGVCFDNTFNLASNDQMYCSEMISKALKESTDNRISIEPTKLTTAEATIFSAYAHLPFSYTSHLEIVSIDDLYVNPLCRLVKEYHYAN